MSEQITNMDGLHLFKNNEAPWERVRTVAPLILVGSKGQKSYDMAPKHLAMPLGWDNYFCFVCAPHHQTYKNIKSREEFTVSFVLPNQVVLASLSASPKRSKSSEMKDVVSKLPTLTGASVDAPFLKESYLFLECKLHSMIDGFGKNSLIIGQVVRSLARQEYLINEAHDGGDQIHQNPILAYLAPDRFATISDSNSFPFPKDFRK